MSRRFAVRLGTLGEPSSFPLNCRYLRVTMTQTAGGPPRHPKREGAALRTTPVPAAPVTVTHGLRRRLSTVGSIVESPARALASPGGVVGTLVEAAWLTTHSALYPLGLFG